MSTPIEAGLQVIGDASQTTVRSTGSTTARKISVRAADLINARDWGAVLNGSSDDLAVLQAIYTYYPSTYKTLVIDGPCYVSANYTLGANLPVRFEGSGAFVGPGTVTYTRWLPEAASATVGGIITIGAQTISGVKTFSSGILVPSLDQSSAAPLPIGATNATSLELGKSGVPTKVYGPVTGAQSQINAVAATYNTSTAQNMPNNSRTIVNFDTKEIDTDNAVTTGASWKFTCPAGKAGLYHVAASVACPGAGAGSFVELYLNGGEKRVGSGGTDRDVISTYVYLTAGDYIDIRFYQNSGVDHTLNPYAVSNWITIVRVPGS